MRKIRRVSELGRRRHGGIADALDIPNSNVSDSAGWLANLSQSAVIVGVGDCEFGTGRDRSLTATL